MAPNGYENCFVVEHVAVVNTMGSLCKRVRNWALKRGGKVQLVFLEESVESKPRYHGIV